MESNLPPGLSDSMLDHELGEGENKYLIDYQLEDIPPEHNVAKGRTEEEAITKLKILLINELVDDGEEREEAECFIDTIQVLEIREV